MQCRTRQSVARPAIGDHLLARFGGSGGPLLVALGGIHGNEPAGVEAMKTVAAELSSVADQVRGEVLFLAGNTRALAAGSRFIDEDLNRAWTPERLDRLAGRDRALDETSEEHEVREIAEILESLDQRAYESRYFVDLHTMSACGGPFATIGDSLDNREFALAFPLPKVLGLEENIDGTLLEYQNSRGFITAGFEAGQHEAPESVAIHEAILRIALVTAGSLPRESVADLDRSLDLLERLGGGGRFYEVRKRHAVRPGDTFAMAPGYKNFAPVRRGEILASDWRGPIRADEDGVVMLPRYQERGDDGFFIGREIRPVWLRLAATLRRTRIERVLPLLPGVRRQVGSPGTLIVNTRTARLFPLELFHLLGYRKRRWVDDLLVVSRRR